MNIAGLKLQRIVQVGISECSRWRSNGVGRVGGRFAGTRKSGHNNQVTIRRSSTVLTS